MIGRGKYKPQQKNWSYKNFQPGLRESVYLRNPPFERARNAVIETNVHASRRTANRRIKESKLRYSVIANMIYLSEE